MENNVPDWVTTFARKYYTRTITQFILYGNTTDFVCTKSNNTLKYSRLRDYLMYDLFRRRDLVVSYDRASGILFREKETGEDFSRSLTAYDTLHGTSFARQLPRDPARALMILDNYFRIRVRDKKRIAFIIEYADTIVPMGTTSNLSPEDRSVLVFLQKWAKDAEFLNADMTIVLVAENLSEINHLLVRNPYTCEIEIPYPNEKERSEYISYCIQEFPNIPTLLEMPPDILANHTAGINLVHLKTLLYEISENKQPFTFKQLTEKKKTIIESESGGLLEFVETKFTLDNVAGHSQAKGHLRMAAQALKSGHGEVLPMGYLVNGPVGTGKTFMVTCFAGEIGIPMLLLKNFRSQWVGVTETNLEKVFKLLEAMTPVAVMIDEADAYLGNRSNSGDSGVSSRVFSMIASFMSNTEHRGKIIWFLLTARPDLMPVDLKRQGRAEEHIALFYPQTVEERKDFFLIMLKKTGLSYLKGEQFNDEFFEKLQINSGADMEAALIRAKFKAIAAGKPQVTPEDVQYAFADFIPPTYPEEIELMNLVAVIECTSKELLPPKYRDLKREEVLEKMQLLKRVIAQREI